MMDNPPLAPIRRYDWAWVAAASALLLISFVILASWKNSITSSNLAAHHGQPHPDIADHRRLRLVIAEAVHPGQSGTQ